MSALREAFLKELKDLLDAELQLHTERESLRLIHFLRDQCQPQAAWLVDDLKNKSTLTFEGISVLCLFRF